MLDKILELLNTIEAPKELPEDFEVHSWAGGNIDDAYELGYEHGYDRARHVLAVQLLEIINER